MILLSFRIFFLFLFAFGKEMEAIASPAEVRKMFGGEERCLGP